MALVISRVPALPPRWPCTSAGTSVVCGHDVTQEPVAVKRRIGYLPEGAPAYPDMTPDSFLRFIAGIRGFSGEDAAKQITHRVAFWKGVVVKP